MGHFSSYLAKYPNKIPTFVGIKFTSNDLEEALQFTNNNRQLKLFLGSDVVRKALIIISVIYFIHSGI